LLALYKSDAIISDKDRPLEKVLKDGQALSFGMEDNFYYKISSGKKFPIMLICTPLFRDSGIIGAVLVFRDITSEKALDESKSSFISIASHQLRTPLTSMRWFSEMLIGGDAGPLQEEQKHFVERIYQATDRMIDLVNLLLQIARVEAGRIKVEPISLSLKDLTQSVAATLKTNLDLKSQTVNIVTDPDPFPLLPLDQDIVWQVIQNLLSNASRYSQENKTILVSIIKKDDVIEYSVKDQGIGIPMDQRARLFEKFFRAENALKMVPEGSGLGLSLVKSLVEGWGGRIWFESEEEKGTTFFFTIPAAGMSFKEGEVKLAI
jgi:signal transduction histidine kinase